MKTRPATILKARYDSKQGIIIWVLGFNEDGKEQSYCYSRADYLTTICNISADNHDEVTEEMLFDHCEDMTDKQINFGAEETIPEPKNDETEQSIAPKDLEKLKREAGDFFKTL